MQDSAKRARTTYLVNLLCVISTALTSFFSAPLNHCTVHAREQFSPEGLTWLVEEGGRPLIDATGTKSLGIIEELFAVHKCCLSQLGTLTGNEEEGRKEAA